MGVPSWMVRRFPRGGRGVDDEVKLDPKKGFVDNLREVLNNVCKRQGISEDKRIAYLNSFIRLINPGNNQEIGISRDDFFHCLRPLLIHESVRIRATALNLVRHFLRSKQDFASCVKLQYSFLIARSLDLKVQSDSERVQAMCVARRMLCVDADQFPMAVARALVAIATSTIDEKDRLLRAALAALVELCLLNPDTFITSGGVTALTRNLGSIAMARMAESMLGALLFLLNKPHTRARARIDLECLAAPYTDPGGGGVAGAGAEPPKKGGDGGTLEGRLDWAHVVLVSLLRSWPGLLHFCHTEKEGLRSIVATLYLNQHEVRRSVVDLLYEVCNVPQPEWSDEPQVALDAVDPSRYQDAFRLGEGFVAAEGRTVLPHCSRTRVNLQEVHLSLLLYSLLEAGVLDAIVEVIVSDDSFLSVRATILLGELLHLTHLLLPPECCHVTPVLPTLVSYAVRGRRSAANLTNFGAAAGNRSSAHYERFRRQMQQQAERKKESGRRRRGGVGDKEGEGGRGKRERRRTVSGQSCRSRTVSDSSGDRSRLDRDSLSAQVDPVPNDPYSSVEPKTTSKATSLLRDIQSVLKDQSEVNSSTTSLEGIGVSLQQDNDIVDNDKVTPEIIVDRQLPDSNKVDNSKLTSETLEDSTKVDSDKLTLEILDRQLKDSNKVKNNKLTSETLKDTIKVDNDKVCDDQLFANSNYWEAGHQPLPEFFEKGEIFEEDDQNFTARYPVDGPFSIRVQQRALTAVSTLARLHRLLRKRPAPSSIFLDHLITSIDKKQTPSSSELARAKGKTLSKSKLSQLLNKESEEAIKDSGVLVVKDPFSWNWDIIRSILKGKTDFSNETNHRLFVRKLLQFFLPSSRQLMRIDVGSDRRLANIYTMTALDLLDCLVNSPKDSECEKMLYELLGNISTEICQVKSSPHSCLLSPQNVSGTLCSDYFLYVGHLSRSETGRNVLEKTGVFKLLLELISSTNLDCYVKLVVSTLDYTEPGFARKIMDAALKSEVVSFRLYGTKLLHVLLRTPMQDCQSMIDWVVVSLIDRVGDSDRAISNIALEALDEACDCLEYLKSVIKMFPIHLETHSDSGLMVVIRLLSTTDGFIRMLEEGFVKKQLDYWGEEFNLRYVCVVEARLCDSLTLHERNEDGTYCGRVSGVKRSPNDVFVPAHLYGQLVQHEAGFKMLIANEHVKKLVEIVLQANTRTDADILALKSALWALGAVATWGVGARWVRALGVAAAMLRLVHACPVYSVRGTALYALSMLATNEDGACTLREEGGWHTTRHNRHERWPVLVKLDLLEDVVVNDDDEQDTSQDSSSCGGGVGLAADNSAADNNTLGGRGHFFLPLDSDDQLSTVADHLGPAADQEQPRQRRAATLPATLPGARGVSGMRLTPGAAYQHTRSYSESKADPSEGGGTAGADSVESRANLSIDGLRKNRPSSCDISSGSSTDSVQQYGKYNVGDRIQKLSPIPSSGSLTTIKYPAVTNPRSRRTSVTNSTSSHKSARLSHQDALGYATLRFLHRGRRPLASSPPPLTSPLSPIEQLASADLRRQISPLVRPRHLHHHRHHHSMTSTLAAAEFDAGQGSSSTSSWQHVLSDEAGAGGQFHNMPYQSSRSCIARGSDASGADESSWSGPTYLGICLPHNLCDLFPSDDLRHDKPPYARAAADLDTVQDAGMENSSGDSETDTGTDSGGGGGGACLAVGGALLAGAAYSNGRQRKRHDRQNCLLCTSNRAANQRVSRLRKISSSSTHRTRTETESSYGAANEGESPIMLPWQTRGGLEGVNSVDSSSTDATSIIHRSPMDNMRSRSMVRRDILKLACQLSNPVLYKTCKQALLQLKQLYNDLFQDICVYSDVCSIIANSMHRIQARRFLQELFLDIPFTELYEDAITLLSNGGGVGGENGLDDYDQLIHSSGGGGDQLFCNQLTASSADGGGGGDSSSVSSCSDANPTTTSGGNNFRSSKAGAKSAFTDEQRSNPLLEVIPEHDARSDSSDPCCRADSLSQSMLNLSDFSAPNSFDAENDGVLSASFDRRASSQITATSPSLMTSLVDHRPRLLSTSSASSTTCHTKPLILQTHSDYTLLLKTSTSLPSSSSLSSSSRPRPTSRSLSIERETEKAKQMIEMSSSKISVLQEALKQQTNTSLSSSSSNTATANQGRGFGAEETASQKRGEGNVVLESADRKEGLRDVDLKSADQKKGLKVVSLKSADQKKGLRDVDLKSADHREGLKVLDLEGTNQGSKILGSESTNEKRVSDVVELGDAIHPRLYSKNDPRLDRRINQGLTNPKVDPSLEHNVDHVQSESKFDPNLTTKVDSSLSSLKSDQSQKLDLGISSVEITSKSDPGQKLELQLSNLDVSLKSDQDQKVDLGLSNLQLEVDSVSSVVSDVTFTKSQLSESKIVGNLVSAEEKIAVESQSSSVTLLSNIDSAVNFGNVVRSDNKDANLSLVSNQGSPKIVEESSTIATKNIDSLQRLSSIEKASLKSCTSPTKSVDEVSKQKYLMKNVSETCTNVENLEKFSKEFGTGSSSLKAETSFAKTECTALKSDSIDSKLETDCTSDSSNLKTDVSTLKSDSSFLKLESSSTSKPERTPLKAGSHSSKTKRNSSKADGSSLKSSMKSESACMKPEPITSKLESGSSKLESGSSKLGSGSSKWESGSSKFESSSSKLESSSSKSESSSSKLDSGSSKMKDGSSKIEIISESDKRLLKTDSTPLKPVPIISRSEGSSSKSESSSSKLDCSSSKSESGSSKPEPTTSKSESGSSKLDCSSSKSESGSSKPESTTSKPSKETKTSIKGKRLKSQLNTGSSLLSTSSPSSSSPSSSSSKTSTKITPKRNDDITGTSGGENTKSTTGTGSENTKPTTAVKRQRKKATTKEPIRESLEVGKK